MTLSGRWVELKTSRGHAFRVWRRYQSVPKIQQHYLDCCIYLYASEDSAKEGENFGGSGCLVSVESKPVFDPDSFKDGMYRRVSLYFPPHIYAVTNKHVAKRGFPVVRLNTIDGQSAVLPLERDDWIPHPGGDDLAVAPIDLAQSTHAYFPISSSLFVHRHSVSSYLGAGDDTFMVGRFISHAGKQRNTPSLRFGSIAMLPFEKVKLGAEAGNHMQEAFLVETRSISGFSGSPVFVYKPSEHMTEDTPYSYGVTSITDLVGHVTFLGIDCGHAPKYERIVDGAGNEHPHGWKVGGNTGMAIVIPAWRLEDFLDTPELMMQRQRKDRQYQKEKEAEETVVMDSEQPEPFTQGSYEDALRRASQKVSEPEPEKKRKP